MSLFDSLNIKQQQPAQMTPMQMLQAIKQNPVSVLQQAGFTIPDGMTDPEQMAQHLLSSGQVTQRRYNAAMQMARRVNHV